MHSIVMNKFSIRLKEARKNIGVMPRLLKFIFTVLFSTAFGLLLVGFWPWPGAQYSMNGVSLSYAEFWSSGMAFIFLAGLFVMLLLSYGMAFKKRWSRWGLLAPSVMMLAFSLNADLFSLSVLAIICIALALYLFRRHSVRFYFSNNQHQNA